MSDAYSERFITPPGSYLSLLIFPYCRQALRGFVRGAALALVAAYPADGT